VQSWPQRGRFTLGDRRELEQLMGRMVQCAALRCAADQNPGLLGALEQHSDECFQREAEAFVRKQPKQRIEREERTSSSSQRQANSTRPSPPLSTATPPVSSPAVTAAAKAVAVAGKAAATSKGVPYRRYHAPSPRQTRAQVLQMKWKGISAHAKKLREKAAEEEKLRQKRNDAAVEEATERLEGMLLGRGPPCSPVAARRDSTMNNNSNIDHPDNNNGRRSCDSPAGGSDQVGLRQDHNYQTEGNSDPGRQGRKEREDGHSDANSANSDDDFTPAKELTRDYAGETEDIFRCVGSIDAALRPTAALSPAGHHAVVGPPRRRNDPRSSYRHSMDERIQLPNVNRSKAAVSAPVGHHPRHMGGTKRENNVGNRASAVAAINERQQRQQSSRTPMEAGEQQNHVMLNRRRTSEPGRASTRANADAIAGRTSATASCSSWSEIAELLNHRMRAADDDPLQIGKGKHSNRKPPISVSVDGPFYSRPSVLAREEGADGGMQSQVPPEEGPGVYRSRRLQSSPVVSEDGSNSVRSSSSCTLQDTMRLSSDDTYQSGDFEPGAVTRHWDRGEHRGGSPAHSCFDVSTRFTCGRGDSRARDGSSTTGGDREEQAHYGRRAPPPPTQRQRVGASATNVPEKHRQQCSSSGGNSKKLGSSRRSTAVAHNKQSPNDSAWTSVRAPVPVLGVKGRLEQESTNYALPYVTDQAPERISSRNNTAHTFERLGRSSSDGRSRGQWAPKSGGMGSRRGGPAFGFGSSSVKPTAVPLERSSSGLLTGVAASRALLSNNPSHSYPYPQPDVYTLIGSRGSDANRGIQKKVIELLRLQAETVKEEREKAR